MNRVGASLGDAARRGVGQLVRLANDEILESEALVECRELRSILANFEHDGGIRADRWGSGVVLLLASGVSQMVKSITSGGNCHNNGEIGYPLVFRSP